MNAKKWIIVIAALFLLGTVQARLVFTKIDNPGFYLLSDELDNSVTIEVSDVTFDLNGHTITAANGIIINGGLDNIKVLNGDIRATTDGVIVNAGCTGIELETIRVDGAIRGINFDNVTGGVIKNCEMTQNTTGILLDTSHKIIVKDCIANCNMRAGYDLLSSTTNCFENCKALSTGEGNSDQFDTTIFGFISNDGYGNIFERCIANSTQALSTTDSNSLIAGFALRGSESGTKIIDSESANAQTDPSGFTVPYGILLENSFDTTQTVTGALGTGTVNGVDWSPDGKYVAVCGTNIVAKEDGGDTIFPTLVQIYSFDRERGDFGSLSKALVTSGGVDAIAWSPSGEYVAVAFETELQVYAFDKVAKSLTLFNAINPDSGNISDITWSFDERFIALAADTSFNIYSFDRVTGEFIQAASSLSNVNSVSFTSDGRYLAVGTATGSGSQLYVLEVSPLNGSIVLPVISELSGFSDVRSVDWSPDGEYLAVGGANIIIPEGNAVQVFRHNRDTVSLTSIVGDLATTGTVLSVDWSSDGHYLAVTGSSIGSGTGDDFQILEFDRAAETLQVRDGALGSTSFLYDGKWSPDGEYLVIGGVGITGGSGDLFQIMSGLQFTKKNVIKGNTVYSNSGGQFPSGVGISGSSIANMIIGNVAYNNPLATTKNKPIVGSNYQFGTNTFNQFFGQMPSDTQNISLDGCDPLCTPNDIPLLIHQILYKTIGIESQQDVIESKLDQPCSPTPIFTAGTISTSGIYCLANEITGAITIAASDVDLDLNNYRVTQGITINAGLDQVKIRNGVVEGSSNAILVNSGSTNVSIEDVVVKNAILGINFDNVTGGVIKNCEMTLNTTGIELNNSHKITIDSSLANCNTHAGFDLISSTTCVIQNCKALSTGEGNSDIDTTTVFGFSSLDGYGNIFERCIANSTQALSVTGSSSVIAGFALRGLEGCTKIIDSESANTQTYAGGFTVPYGILLEAGLGATANVTGAFGNSGLNPAISVAWSSDGKYVAVTGASLSGGTGDNLQILSFEKISGALASITGLLDGSIVNVNWSPNNGYVVICGNSITEGTGDQVQILYFDQSQGTVKSVTGVLPNAVNASTVDWSPDGLYVAVGGNGLTDGTGDELQVFSFDRAAETLSSVAGALGTAGGVTTVDWSPDGLYVAVGGDGLTGGSGDEFQIFSFDKGAATLTSVTGALGTAGTVNTVNWSADGQYLAVGGGGLTGGTGNNIQIYRFDRNGGSLTSISGIFTTGTVNTVNWSADGQYLAVGGSGLTEGTADEFQIVRFDKAAETLNSVTGSLEESSNGQVRGVNWSPDGEYIALAGSTLAQGSANNFQIFTGLTFPAKNVITGNTVYCNSGAQFPSGVGISGSSISNMIIGNTCYSNPVPKGAYQPAVGTNYQFVTNVFNQLFGQIPSDIQNISLDGCKPICTPEDIALLVKQTLYKVEALGCGVNTLSTLDISSGTITISEPGNYFLCSDVTADITITATCVSLDLNDRCVTGVIDATAVDDVIIKNGFVTPPAPTSAPSAAITIPSTTNDATIEHVTIICADTVDAVAGRVGIETAGNYIAIKHCTIRSGSGGDDAGANAGGSGISVASDAYKTIIDECIIETGNGGNGGNAGAGGDGGNGILVDSNTALTEIKNSLIMCTGNGGNSNIAAGGAGGHGISIASTAADTSVRNCTIRNTGSGGTGTSAGAPGKAIDDDVTTTANLSQIFANFAHNIANSTKFDLQAAGEAGILTPNPPTATVINPFANVYSS